MVAHQLPKLTELSQQEVFTILTGHPVLSYSPTRARAGKWQMGHISGNDLYNQTNQTDGFHFLSLKHVASFTH